MASLRRQHSEVPFRGGKDLKGGEQADEGCGGSLVLDKLKCTSDTVNK